MKDLGSCDVYPQSVAHNSNGRFVAVCGDGEYIVYTALAWRNKSYGSALEFVWGDDSSVFATRYGCVFCVQVPLSGRMLMACKCCRLLRGMRALYCHCTATCIERNVCHHKVSS